MGLYLASPGLVFADGMIDSLKDVKYSGYLDGSYNRLQRSSKFTSGTNNRLYDIKGNGFALQQAGVTMAYQPAQGWGGLLNIIGGQDAILTAPYGFRPASEFDSQHFAFDFLQSYLQLASGPITVIGGRFLTMAGTEQVDPTLNVNFSRSILASNVPTTHTGVRGTYTVNNKLDVSAGLNDGWDSIRDWNRGVTVELGMNYAMDPRFAFAAHGYSGVERVTSQTDFGSRGTRTLFDLVATLNATEKLTFIANYDYAWQTRATLLNGNVGRATWTGIAGYANYKFNDLWRTSLRGEVFYDKNGYRTGVRQNWREATLTVGYIPIKNLEVRAETRRDFSNVDSFVNKKGVGVSNNQQSYALEAVYKFS